MSTLLSGYIKRCVSLGVFVALVRRKFSSMGDANATSFPLPPGVRFHPSDEELLRHYLSGKNVTHWL
ncbi:hypothetical protein L484_002259 [Morus notabilis]|uniref:NAC domain-containing protein n=1 Tax=Morus notabilis TaxID=981085 RepID=W9SGW4_9ROSA|nr:hypothetical protein L484_002259 [Morus notabilis]